MTHKPNNRAAAAAAAGKGPIRTNQYSKNGNSYRGTPSRGTLGEHEEHVSAVLVEDSSLPKTRTKMIPRKAKSPVKGPAPHGTCVVEGRPSGPNALRFHKHKQGLVLWLMTKPAHIMHIHIHIDIDILNSPGVHLHPLPSARCAHDLTPIYHGHGYHHPYSTIIISHGIYFINKSMRVSEYLVHYTPPKLERAPQSPDEGKHVG